MALRKIVTDRRYYVNDDGTTERGSKRRILREADYRALMRVLRAAEKAASGTMTYRFHGLPSRLMDDLHALDRAVAKFRKKGEK